MLGIEEVGEGGGGVGGKGGGVGQGREMTQALYAHMNNKTIKKKEKGFCLNLLFLFNIYAMSAF
jgi:hypothetical protein